jgi:hypothetical protein
VPNAQSLKPKTFFNVNEIKKERQFGAPEMTKECLCFYSLLIWSSNEID